MNGHGPVRRPGRRPSPDPGPRPVRPRARRAAAVPFMLRRRQRSRFGPLVVAVALVAGFIGATFAIGYLVGRMLL